MGYKLVAQLVLIGASLVIIFAFTQPWLAEIKTKQDELLQYSEAISKASQLNTRLRELIAIRDSFSTEDIRSLEKFVPVEIDELKTMSEIAGIFSSRSIPVTSLTASEPVNPVRDVSFESGIMVQSEASSELAYQDFEVSFTGSYEQLKEVLLLTEASDSLLEITELDFTTVQQQTGQDEAAVVSSTANGGFSFKIIFRTFGLPIATSS